jgi:5-dehydro-4-deoxyglucarate dehydratase
MKPDQLRQKLSSGVISFPLTPFKRNLSLDLEGHRRNLRYILKFPITAIVAPAGTGEM